MNASHLETLAQELEASADYRVLRRLSPAMEFAPPRPGARVIQVIILDTETTGLDATKEKLIELAMLRVGVDIDTGLAVGHVDVYDGLEDPGQPLTPEVMALTGLTDAMLSGQRLDEARINRMLTGADVVIAHNAGFDRPFAQSRMSGFADIPWACSWADVDWKAHGHASAKLESLALAHGWFYDAHRAEVDCHALLAILLRPPGVAAHDGIQKTALSMVLKVARKPRFFIEAIGASFDMKDALKAKGYRWDADQKLWGKTVLGGAVYDEEMQWLGSEIYGGRAARVRVSPVSPLQRFTGAAGPAEMIPIN